MEYMYFCLCRAIRTIGTNGNPAYSAMLILALFQGANLLAIVAELNHLFFGVQIATRTAAIAIGLVAATILLLINYKWLYVRANLIEKRFAGTHVWHVRVGAVSAILYGIGSYALAYYVSK